MERIDVLLEPARVFLTHVADFLPRLALAVVVLLLGWLIAKAGRFTVVKGLRAINFHVLSERAGIDGFLKQGGIEKDASDILGVLVYWLAIFAALVIGFNSLGLTYITDLAGKVVLFLSHVVVASLIIALGAYFARIVGDALDGYCRSAGVPDAALLGRIARYAIIIFVVLMALEELGVAGDIVRYSFLIILAGLVLALALAFGFGGKRWAADILERWWPSRDRRGKP
jgi:hypothetical protein